MPEPSLPEDGLSSKQLKWLKKLPDYLNQDTEGQELLKYFSVHQCFEQKKWESWLNKNSDKLPPGIFTNVSGGEIGNLINVAKVNQLYLDKADNLNIKAEHVWILNEKRIPESKLRKRIRERVYRYWIENVLDENPFYQQNPFPLQLRLWNFSNWELNRGGRKLTLEETVTSRFHKLVESNGGMLLLGRPGSGKSIALLEAAKALLNQAKDDFECPVPLILNLMSWTDKRLRIEDWIIEEIIEFYKEDKKSAIKLVHEEALVFLLDGLDEVPAEYRQACWEAIINFKESIGRDKGLLVCCRIDDGYSQNAFIDNSFLNGRFLDEKILIEPLSSKQIDEYFIQQGDSLAAVREVCREDKVMRDLTEVPLFLWIMSIAYSGYTVKNLKSLTFQERLNDLFTVYIDRLTDKPNNFKRYLTPDVDRKSLELHNMFAQELLARVETDSDRHNKTYQGRVKIRGYSKFKTIKFLVFLSRQMDRIHRNDFRIEKISPSWLSSNLEQYFIKTLSSSIAVLPISINTFLQILQQFKSIPYSLFSLLFFQILSTFVVLFSETRLKKIQPENLTWSLSKLISSIVNNYKILVGLLLVISIVCFGLSFLNQNVNLISYGFKISIASLLPGIFILGFKPSELSESEAISPNLGILKARNNALFTGIGIGLVGGIVMTLINQNPSHNFVNVSLMIGIPFGMMFGGSSCIQHIFTRLILCRRGYIPEDYTDFLEYARERLLMYRAGGSYIFIHRVLMEHFANLAVDR